MTAARRRYRRLLRRYHLHLREVPTVAVAMDPAEHGAAGAVTALLLCAETRSGKVVVLDSWALPGAPTWPPPAKSIVRSPQ